MAVIAVLVERVREFLQRTIAIAEQHVGHGARTMMQPETLVAVHPFDQLAQLTFSLDTLPVRELQLTQQQLRAVIQHIQTLIAAALLAKNLLQDAFLGRARALAQCGVTQCFGHAPHLDEPENL